MTCTATIVMDRHCKDRPFYLRIKDEHGSVTTIDIPGVITPLGARNAARKLGYDPKEWFETGTSTGTGTMNKFY